MPVIDALLATTVALAAAAAVVYWYACAVAEKEIASRAPQYAALVFRDHVEALVMRLPPVRLSVLLRERPPSDAIHLVSPLKTLGVIHLATLAVAVMSFVLWTWLG
jgi:hypothetical protein